MTTQKHLKLAVNNQNSVDDVIHQFYLLNHEIKQLELQKNEMYARIKEFMLNLNQKTYFSQEHEVQLINTVRNNLSKDLLKEMGVTEETITLCSNETTVIQLRVK